MADEWVDILDEKGGYTGKRALKSEAHRKGLFHPTVHVWFYTPNRQILLQKRGRNKRSFPLKWDVSVAGHVMAGEKILDAAVREIHEEIGLEVAPSALKAIGIFPAKHLHSTDFKDFEFHHSFICELNIPLAELKKQEQEVEELKIIPLLQFAEESWGMGKTESYVPHGADYYKAIVQAINNELSGGSKWT